LGSLPVIDCQLALNLAYLIICLSLWRAERRRKFRSVKQVPEVPNLYYCWRSWYFEIKDRAGSSGL